ncbi:MAG: hypothetical protein KZQ71_12845, partial [Candidatus Thiodiazotropha sp. (ex Lucinoma aequizonata)]|nr:hypothetical protein [Candidatus Thiodiazotropha sp. (ex Lucinoma aequizonata)]
PLHCGSYVYIRSFTNVRSKLRGIEPQEIKARIKTVLDFIETLDICHGQIKVFPKNTLLKLIRLGAKVPSVSSIS